MKRVLTFLAILLLPMSVWAMTPVSDSALSDVTGQAGVNINADLTMSINIGTMAWGDADGITSAACNAVWDNVAAGGYIGVTGFNIDQLTIMARYDAADTYNGYSTLFLKPITIDVATGDKTAVGGAADTTFVRFGLGALKVGISQLQFSVALGARPAAGDPVVLDQQMGLVSIDQMEIYFNPWSYVDIFAHAGCGVTMDMNVIIDQLTLPKMSWGDTDGIGDTSALSNNEEFWMSGVTEGGYIGFNNFSISADPADVTLGAISMKGAVAIDVVTAAHGVYPDLEFLTNLLVAGGAPTTSQAGMIAYLASQSIVPGMSLSALIGAHYDDVPSISAVHISFPGAFNLHVGTIRGDVALGSDAWFEAGTFGTLGDIYVQGMDVTVAGGSWVDIWAH